MLNGLRQLTQLVTVIVIAVGLLGGALLPLAPGRLCEGSESLEELQDGLTDLKVRNPDEIRLTHVDNCSNST